MRAFFRAHKHECDQRVATVEGAVDAIAGGTLDHALRASAERDAHKPRSRIDKPRPRCSRISAHCFVNLGGGVSR